MINNCAIIVSSFDGYSSAWYPFFTLFYKYWPDCPFPVYLIGNHLEYNDKRVTTINITPDKKWSGNLKRTLEQIKEDYIIYLQEDYFLTDKVETDKIIEMLKYIKKEQAAYLRLDKKSGIIDYKTYKTLGEIPKSSKYLNSTQAAIWDKNILKNILKEGETGWDFEVRKGIERAKKINMPFLCSRESIIPYFKTAIVKGKYVYEALKICERENIKIWIKPLKRESYLESILKKNTFLKKLKSIYKYIKN